MTGSTSARDRDAAIRRLLGHDLGGTLLVRRVDEGKQKADRDCLDALARELAYRGAQRRFVERDDDLAFIIKPFDNLLGEILRREQRRLLVEGIEQVCTARLRPAARLVDRAEALGDEQAGAHSLAFEHRVRGDRRAVHEHGDVGWPHAFGKEAFQRIDHGERRIARHRWHFRPPQRSSRWSKAIRSVNVPPVSTPTSQFATLTVSPHAEC